MAIVICFFNDTATTEIYTLSLHDALPISYRANALDGHPWQDWANAQTDADGEHRMPGAVSRWNAKKDLSWVPLRPELVVEIKYDQLEGRRLRRSEEHTSELQSRQYLVCRLLLEKKKNKLL